MCEPLDLLTNRPPRLAEITSTNLSGSCRSDLHNGRTFGPFLFTKLFQLSNILGRSGRLRSLRNRCWTRRHQGSYRYFCNPFQLRVSQQIVGLLKALLCKTWFISFNALQARAALTNTFTLLTLIGLRNG